MTPILDNKNASVPSVFRPAALLREARRQKNLTVVGVAPVCVLDPDGDIVRRPTEPRWSATTSMSQVRKVRQPLLPA